MASHKSISDLSRVVETCRPSAAKHVASTMSAAGLLDNCAYEPPAATAGSSDCPRMASTQSTMASAAAPDSVHAPGAWPGCIGGRSRAISEALTSVGKPPCQNTQIQTAVCDPAPNSPV